MSGIDYGAFWWNVAKLKQCSFLCLFNILICWAFVCSLHALQAWQSIVTRCNKNEHKNSCCGLINHLQIFAYSRLIMLTHTCSCVPLSCIQLTDCLMDINSYESQAITFGISQPPEVHLLVANPTDTFICFIHLWWLPMCNRCKTDQMDYWDLSNISMLVIVFMWSFKFVLVSCTD